MKVPIVDGIRLFFGELPCRVEPHDTAQQREEAAAALKLLQYRVDALTGRQEKDDERNAPLH